MRTVNLTIIPEVLEIIEINQEKYGMSDIYFGACFDMGGKEFARFKNDIRSGSEIELGLVKYLLILRMMETERLAMPSDGGKALGAAALRIIEKERAERPVKPQLPPLESLRPARSVRKSAPTPRTDTTAGKQGGR